MLISIILFALGITFLIIGGNWLVSGASTFAKWLRIPAMIIGLTIVSMGTSAPELVVNIKSALSGSTALALGNIVGSNIANILLILGISTIIAPIIMKKDTRTKDMPLMLLASLLVWVFVNDTFFDGSSVNALSRVESIALLGFFVIFMVSMYFSTLSLEHTEEDKHVSHKELLKSLFFIPAGITLLAFGGDMTVDSATNIAELAGISERIIGLTIVAVGTSLPELVTSIVAALKRNTDILIGNIIGSNIFNIFFILGVTGTIKPLVFDTLPNLDFIFMTGAVLILFLSLYVGKRHIIGKLEGVAMILVYIIYLLLITF